jgi:hypothetical protein
MVFTAPGDPIARLAMGAEVCIDCPRGARRPATGWHRCDEHRRVYWHRRRQESRDERRLVRVIFASYEEARTLDLRNTDV